MWTFPVAAAAFRPTEEQVTRARRIVDAARGSGAVLVDGAVVDGPVVERARRILTRST